MVGLAVPDREARAAVGHCRHGFALFVMNNRRRPLRIRSQQHGLPREHDDVLLDTTIFVGLSSSPRTALCLGRRTLVASSLSVATMDMALVH